MATVVYSCGLCYLSACTDDTDEIVTQTVNNEHPTGIAPPWTIASEPFADGTANPCPCNDDPNRRHVLFSC